MRTKDIIAAVAIGVVVANVLERGCRRECGRVERVECFECGKCPPPPPPKPLCKCFYKRCSHCD